MAYSRKKAYKFYLVNRKGVKRYVYRDSISSRFVRVQRLRGLYLKAVYKLNRRSGRYDEVLTFF